MYTTYHFKSTSEITTDVLEAIKTAFKGKSVVITVEEGEPEDDVPEWQQKLVMERVAYYKKHPEELLEWDSVKDKFKLD